HDGTSAKMGSAVAGPASATDASAVASPTSTWGARVARAGAEGVGTVVAIAVHERADAAATRVEHLEAHAARARQRILQAGLATHRVRTCESERDPRDAGGVVDAEEHLRLLGRKGRCHIRLIDRLNAPVEGAGRERALLDCPPPRLLHVAELRNA